MSAMAHAAPALRAENPDAAMSPLRRTVIVVGAGPTGLVLANLLAMEGVHVLVLERAAMPLDEARAVTIDDESLRTLQSAGVIDAVLRNVVLGYGVHYYSWRNRLFSRIEPHSTEYGYPKRNAFRQPLLVRDLLAGLQRFPHAEVLFGHAVQSIRQDAAGVSLKVATAGGTHEARCDWLVGCDGGRSVVREQIGASLDGSTYAEKWLIADLLDRRSPFRHTRTYCDPVRPAIRLPGPHGTLRYEFMLREGEEAGDVLRDESLREWIRHRDPDDAQLPVARKVVYTFHARVADRWREGRVFLAGDAAHLTPPFAGQGMNSGVRDAANLAWKLAAVAQERLPEAVLTTYERERKAHAWAMIRMALRIGHFMQPKHRAGAAFAQGLMQVLSVLLPPVRDYVLHLKFKPKPRFAGGFFAADSAVEATVVPGELFPQPRVELPGGARVLLDDVLGPGFCLLQREGVLLPAPPAALRARRVRLVAPGEDILPAMVVAGDATGVVRDCEGVVDRTLSAARADGVLLRPDRYVYAYLRDAHQAAGVFATLEPPAAAPPPGPLSPSLVTESR